MRNTYSDEALTTLVEAWDNFLLATRRARSRVNARNKDELTLSQLQVAQPLLDHPGGLTVGRLAEAAGIAGPSATGVLDILDRGGIVRRLRTGADRRSVTVTLTPKGRKIVQAKKDANDAYRRHFFSELSTDECETIAHALRLLAQLMNEEALT